MEEMSGREKETDIEVKRVRQRERVIIRWCGEEAERKKNRKR